jgi:hypothetical protein
VGIRNAFAGRFPYEIGCEIRGIAGPDVGDPPPAFFDPGGPGRRQHGDRRVRDRADGPEHIESTGRRQHHQIGFFNRRPGARQISVISLLDAHTRKGDRAKTNHYELCSHPG